MAVSLRSVSGGTKRTYEEIKTFFSLYNAKRPRLPVSRKVIHFHNQVGLKQGSYLKG